MPPSQISPDTKAAALADLLAGEQPAVVAERYGVNRNTVRSWAQRLASAHASDTPVYASGDASGVTLRRPRFEVQQQQLGDLILDLLAEKLQASHAIAQAARDPAWLRQQPAAELAALGQWLDASAFAIGDRLAAAAERRAAAEHSDEGDAHDAG